MNEAKEKIMNMVHKECSKLPVMDAYQVLQEVINDCNSLSDDYLKADYIGGNENEEV